MNRRIVFITLLVALLVILNNWLSGQREEAAQEVAAPRHVPDYFLNQFTATTMDQQGRPAQRLSADRMVRYADEEALELEAPRFLQAGVNGVQWHITARHGRMEGEGERLLLEGGVDITRNGAAGGMEMHTTTLLLRPHARYAETADAVSIRHPHGTVTATGLRAWFDEERVQLMAEVRGQYETVAR